MDYYLRNYFRKISDEPTPFEEECGVLGIYSAEKRKDMLSLGQFGLFALQHRGQEACGISVLNEGIIHTYKSDGLVLDAFKAITDLEKFSGNALIGHTRYTTAGDKKKYNFQPLFAKNQFDKTIVSIAHNGNLIHLEPIRKRLTSEGVEFLATSDTEVMLRLIQQYLASYPLHEAIKRTCNELTGAYSVVGVTQNELFAFRDPNGIRPLVLGKKEDNLWVIASETCALDALGAYFEREILPGELVILAENGLTTFKLFENTRKRSCAFEFIYFARPDSILDEKSVHKIRVESGKKLFEQSPVEADIVIGVPDSGVPAAIGYSQESGIPFIPLLIKNRYIGRSFIAPSQELREQVVHLKLNPIIEELEGKRVVLIDDSIVRGTTSLRLVKILKKARVKEIHFRSASPPIISPCFLGIDTPSKDELISAQMNVSELRDFLKVDSLDFLSLDSLRKILGSEEHCFGCFSGRYPVS